MPILKHAKKKLKQDKKRELHNRGLKTAFKNLVKDATKSKTADSLSAAFSAVDKAAKKNLIHENKAAHIKSALSKVVAGPTATTETKVEKNAASAKKAAPKAAVKKAAPKKSAKK
jgi:small subunit ribosomal protein S20